MADNDKSIAQFAGPLRRTFVFTVFLSSSLLFIIEPVAAKSLLPRFGGASTVWLICMMFFQFVLLLGYGCAAFINRYLRANHRAALYVVLLLVGLASTRQALSPSLNSTGHPAIALLVILLQSVGLPFFILSMTTPLLETWDQVLEGTSTSHRLFVAANSVAILALVSYPFLIEPQMALSRQWLGIKVFYVIFSATAILVGLAVRKRIIVAPLSHASGNTPARIYRWICLSATGSALWLSIAEHISIDIAPVPLLWIVPLGLYLLSLAIVYADDRWYNPAICRRVLPMVAGLLIVAHEFHRSATHAGLVIGLNFTALFLALWFCHGELAFSKPANTPASSYYFWIATGGAAGGLVVAVLAPLLFDDLYELPIAWIACGALSLSILYKQQLVRALRLAVLAVLAILVASRVDGARTHTFYKTRDFFGVLRVAEENGRRQLFSGTVLHGSQFLSETLKNTPTTYYGYKSGIGRAIKSEQELHNSVWMAVIGQGAGTLAAYGRHDDQLDFFELDPEVARIANKYFSFIHDARSGVTTLIGDGRLQMAGTARGPYAVIAVDAFSGDYVPTHLLTREAIGIYKSHLADDGVLGFHITNKYLDFAPAVVATAQAVGMYVSVVDAPSDPASDIYASRWVLASKNRMTLDLIGVQISTATARPVWTDDYSNIMKLLR